MSMLGELSRRNVIRVAIAYVIAAWVMIQVADLVLENISAPDWVIQSMMLVVALGFPVALIFSWAYEVTPEGIKRESEIDRSQSITGVTGRKLDRAIIVLLVVAVAYFAWGSRETQAPTTEPAQMAGDASPAVATSNVDSLSIAVLPFDNRSNREEDEFFTIGMHDDLLTTIAKIGSLKVISRTSVMEYKDTTKKIPQIARELGVANILEGGVQRSGTQVRINMQLIDAATDRHLWAENYDRVLTAENLFAIQSEISQAVATALQATLTPDEQRRINTAPTNSLDAHDAYLRARQLMETREVLRLEEAAIEFQRAVELDPQFALAWVGLSDVHAHLNRYGTLSLADSLAVREPAIAKALTIGPDLGEAYASWSHVHSDYGRIDDAESALRKAIELSPNYATSYHWLSNMLRDNILRVGEALEFGEKARELDPRSRIIGVNLAGIYRRSGDFPAAKREIYRVLQLDPGFALGHSVLSALYRDAGDLDEYVRSMVTYTDLDPGGAFTPAILTIAYVELNAIDAANTAFAPLHEVFPDHVATARASLTIAAANGEEKRIRKSLPPLLNSDFGQFFDVIAASGYIMLGEYGLARDAILNSSPTDDLLLPESWPRFIAMYPEAACMFAWALMQTGNAERGEMLVAEALHHFEDLFPKIISHVDRYSPDLCYLAAGDTEKALASIELQFEHGHIAQWNINHRLPLYDPIREHPRYVSAREQYEIKLAELREAAGL